MVKGSRNGVILYGLWDCKRERARNTGREQAYPRSDPFCLWKRDLYTLLKSLCGLLMRAEASLLYGCVFMCVYGRARVRYRHAACIYTGLCMLLCIVIMHVIIYVWILKSTYRPCHVMYHIQNRDAEVAMHLEVFWKSEELKKL